MACILKSTVQLCAWMLEMPITRGDHRCRSESQNNEGIHMFRRDCTTQIISCKPWSPRLCPYWSLVRRMQTYLELKGQDASQPCSSSNQAVKPTSLQKVPAPKGAIDKKYKKRNKMPIRKQFKVRLIEKLLSHTTKPEAIATTATATQTSVMKPTATSTKWPTAKLTPIPLTVYNVLSAKIQQLPSSSMQKSKGGEVPLNTNLNNCLMEQQPTCCKCNPRLQPLPHLPSQWQEMIPHGPTLFCPHKFICYQIMANSPKWEWNPNTSLH